MVGLPPRALRHLWLRYEVEGYTEEIVQDYKQRLAMISSRQVNQAPKKVTATDLFYLRSMDDGTAINVSYLLAQYLFRYGEGRKHWARLSSGYFVGCLTKCFGLVTKEGLQGLTMMVGELRMIDMDELVKLRTSATPTATSVVRTMPQRMARLEEEVHRPRESLDKQREVMDAMAIDFSKFTMWAASGISQLLELSGATYAMYSETHVPYQMRRVKQRTNNACTTAENMRFGAKRHGNGMVCGEKCTMEDLEETTA
nr:hypothetical protein [Tanacetum cinerariifolium]